MASCRGLESGTYGYWSDKDDWMRNMVFSSGKEGSGKVEAEQFLNRHGIGRSKTLVDGSLFFAASGMSAVLSLMIVPVYLYFLVRRKYRRGREGLCLLGIGAAVLAAGVFLIWKLELGIPADLIPSRWSDFDFWTRKLKELQSDLGHMGEAGQAQWLFWLKSRLLLILACNAAWGAGFLFWGSQYTRQI